MKNLDYNRCLQVIKWNIIANKKQLINGTLAMTAAVVILSFLETGMLWNWTDGYNANISGVKQIIFICSCLYIFASAAHINFNMQKKGDIINYAMLPATKLEKFCANWIMKVPVAIAMLFVGIIAGDIIQYLISFLLHAKGNFITVDWLANGAGVHFSSDFYGNVEFFLGIIIFHTTFLYGGVFFRKLAILLTILCWIAFPMVIGAVIAIIGSIAVNAFSETNYDVTIEWLLSPNTIKVICEICFIIFEIAIIALLYWRTYIRFCKVQVINNRLYN